MRYSFTSLIASSVALSAVASAANVHAGHENVHKRDEVAEQYVKVVYQQNLVYVDQNGSPVSTGVQGYSTALVPVEPTTTAQASTSQLPTTPVIVYLTPSSSAGEQTVVVPTTTSSSSTVEYVAPTTTSTSEYVAPTTSTSTKAAETSKAASGSGKFSGEGTFYDAGLGSCGIVSSANDYIVAISHELMDSSFTANPNNNPYCGKSIRAYRDGKSVDVTVVDRCEGCAYNDLDFSNSAFEKLASFNEGRVGITWEWI